jgi:hypothetical protein
MKKKSSHTILISKQSRRKGTYQSLFNKNENVGVQALVQYSLKLAPTTKHQQEDE